MITPKINFEKQFGKGVDPWYAKAERWANKQPNWFVKNFSLGFIAYLKKWWFNVKIENTMRDVDYQTDQILKQWEANDREQTPHIVETGVFGDEGWSIEISNPIVERRSSSTGTGMVAPSDAQRLQEDEGDQGTS